jgi:hypothetical protein
MDSFGLAKCYLLVVADDPGIYVEILICADADEIWRRTQIPDLHERWDLRFTAIEYLPRRSEDEPQRFVYSTRIGFGLSIEGGKVKARERARTLSRRISDNL